eukprot:7918655-Pyramimonas_sp.AAC.1
MAPSDRNRVPRTMVRVRAVRINAVRNERFGSCETSGRPRKRGRRTLTGKGAGGFDVLTARRER